MKNFIGLGRLFIVITVLFMSSCGDSKRAQQKVDESATESIKEAIEEAMEEAVENTTENIGDTPKDIQAPIIIPKENELNKDKYRVHLSVDSIIHLNEIGILRVWLGDTSIRPERMVGMVEDETMFPKSVGKYAKITPVAPDFEVLNPMPAKCHKIDASGSEVRFSIKPKSKGVYRVSANIELFETSDCSGTSTPKTAKTLSVNVNVDRKNDFLKKLDELLNIVWDNFVKFWGALVALLFAVLLFFIRRKLKNKTGFEEDAN
ncbi:hypothetical protein ACFFU1_03600 [Algibacter miyuki]|uniref:Uncharacterized protein n=1 Tax=Algibacter miyuki TaxID=1306933 RepID=A0ABV5GWF4_9FLAO|nr:hypothetical protein [Algibacter miyuki]MDN3665302.1 hypothetical protein [Algibacter miyuki]